MTEYDIAAVLDKMELELLKTMKGHLTPLNGETSEAWQKRQLVELQRFKRENRRIINMYTRQVQDMTKTALKQEYLKSLDNYIKFVSNNAKGKLKAKLMNYGKEFSVETLSGIDDARLISVMDAVNNDIQNKIYSLYRRDEDVYRKTIFDATVHVNSGQYGLIQAIQLAEADFLAKGLTNCPYKNGMLMPIRSYSEMAIRTNAMRAASAARGCVMDYLDIHTVRISHHQSSCPLCGPFQGRIVIDDVYSNGKPDMRHQLLSNIIKLGYKHPNCRHTEEPYDEDIDDNYKIKEYTDEDEKRYDAEQKQRQLERELRKIKRRNAGLVGMSAAEKAKTQQLIKHLQDNPLLKRKKWREEP